MSIIELWDKIMGSFAMTSVDFLRRLEDTFQVYLTKQEDQATATYSPVVTSTDDMEMTVHGQENQSHHETIRAEEHFEEEQFV